MKKENLNHIFLYFFIVEKNIKVFPRFPEVYIGDNLELTCDSYNISEWFFESENILPLNSIPFAQTKTVVIEDIDYSHEGYIYCFGFSRNLDKYFVGRTKLTVYGEFFFIVMQIGLTIAHLMIKE